MAFQDEWWNEFPGCLIFLLLMLFANIITALMLLPIVIFVLLGTFWAILLKLIEKE